MNSRSNPEHENTPERREEPASTAPKLVNPSLTATLHADYEALQNDLQQANDLAQDFQRQLAGKSNEFAQLKQLFEKTSNDLKHMNQGIEELRAERHHLANEAMRATAFQVKLAKVTEERDRLRMELEVIRKALANSGQKMEAALRERDAMIATLVIEAETLKRALAEAKVNSSKPAQAPAPAPTPTPAVKTYKEPPPKPIQLEPLDEFIDITFES